MQKVYVVTVYNGFMKSSWTAGVFDNIEGAKQCAIDQEFQADEMSIQEIGVNDPKPQGNGYNFAKVVTKGKRVPGNAYLPPLPTKEAVKA